MASTNPPASFDLKTYDAFAGSWGDARLHVSADFEAYWRAKFVWLDEMRTLPLKVPLSVLDAGCGSGRYAFEIQRRSQAAGLKTDLKACDVSNELIKIAQETAKTNASDIPFVYGDLGSLPYADIEFDEVFCRASFHHLLTMPAQVGGMNELYRVLKPGGLLFLTVWNAKLSRFSERVKHAKLTKSYPVVNVPWRTVNGRTFDRWYYFFEPEELIELARDAGFEIRDAFYERFGNKTKDVDKAFNFILVAYKPTKVADPTFKRHRAESNSFATNYTDFDMEFRPDKPRGR